MGIKVKYFASKNLSRKPTTMGTTNPWSYNKYTYGSVNTRPRRICGFSDAQNVTTTKNLFHFCKTSLIKGARITDF